MDDVTKPAASALVQSEKEHERITQLLAQQEQSAKLLVRRDLELTRANEHLRALDRLKTDFVSVATHQMRTPLSGIRWTLSMLLKGDLGDLTTEQRTLLMKAYESNERMVALLDDILFSDKIESGGIVVTDETAYVPDLVDNLLTEMQAMAARKNVRINFVHMTPQYPPVQIAPPHLRAILQNLIENAVKYSKPSGSVTITLSEHDGMSCIEVADDGIGIPADQQNRIFSSFFRAPNAVKMETDGSGLGLYIVKNIVNKYRGKVWFESEENIGSKFYVELPIGANHT